MKDIKVKLNVPLLHYRKGEILTFTDGDRGIKLDAFWVKRIQDSKIDNCLEILTDKAPKEENKAKIKKESKASSKKTKQS